MLIQCNIKRDGLTVMKMDGQIYKFEPDALGRNVCRVMNDAHIRYFARFPNNFEQVPEDDTEDDFIESSDVPNTDPEQQGINFNNSSAPIGKHNPLGTVKQRDRDNEIKAIERTIKGLESVLETVDGEQKKTAVENRLEEMKSSLSQLKKPKRNYNKSGQFAKKTKRVAADAAA